MADVYEGRRKCLCARCDKTESFVDTKSYLHECHVSVPEGRPASFQHFLPFKVNKSTILLIEDDTYGEHPHIYIKIYPHLLVITDTGCNAARKPSSSSHSLRHFIENEPLECNGNAPLNPSAVKPYLIICTHAHYDHILGIPPFLGSSKPGTTTPTIIASSHCPSFVTEDLPRHSLCEYIGAETPTYVVSHWAHDLELLPSPVRGLPLRIQTIHTPGHTPDSLAWYDIDEAHLYVGDTFYARKRTFEVPQLPSPGLVPGGQASQAAIIFPVEGNWIDYMASLEKLLDLVMYQNKKLEHEWAEYQRDIKDDLSEQFNPARRVKVAAGHITMDADAEQMLRQVQAFFYRIIAGLVPITSSAVRRGVLFDYWSHTSEAEDFDVLAPRVLVERVRKRWGIML